MNKHANRENATKRRELDKHATCNVRTSLIAEQLVINVFVDDEYLWLSANFDPACTTVDTRAYIACWVIRRCVGQ